MTGSFIEIMMLRNESCERRKWAWVTRDAKTNDVKGIRIKTKTIFLPKEFNMAKINRTVYREPGWTSARIRKTRKTRTIVEMAGVPG